jgi:phosphate:Na+ symporter
LYLQSRRNIKGLGNVLAGLGFFFFGIAMMKTGFDAYSNTLDLSAGGMEGITADLFYVFIGILLTIILQSSSATIAIILTVLAAGQIEYTYALALVIGANVGTTVTAVIAALASNIDGKRMAVAHVTFKILTGVLAVIFLRQLGFLVNNVAAWIHISQDDYTLKLAIFHTLFNLLGIIILSPFTEQFVKILNTKIKDSKNRTVLPLYLNEAALAFPQTALQVMLKETKHLFSLCFEAIAHGLGLSRTTMLSKKEMKALDKEVKYDVSIDEIYYLRIKNIYGEIINFGLKAQRRYADPKYYYAVNGIMEANRYFIEVVKDVKDLQPNVLKYCASDNAVIRNEYNNIRKQIAKFVRIIFHYQEFQLPKPLKVNDRELPEKQINEARNLLNKYVEKLKTKDLLYNGTLNKLIREDVLTAEMVTSLINDSRITNSINKHLMKAAELLYINTGELMIQDPDE